MAATINANTSVFKGANVADSNGTSVTVEVLDTPDMTLGVTITPNVTRIVTGKTLIYTIEITNPSTTQSAQGITFTDTYQSANFTVGTVTSTDTTAVFDTATAGTITGSKFSNLAPGTSITITIPGEVK